MASWKIEWDGRAQRAMRKLDRTVQASIVRYLDERVAAMGDPRQFGGPLRGPRRGLWRYRVGDYRVVCRIENRRLVVLVVEVGHRDKVYAAR